MTRAVSDDLSGWWFMRHRPFPPSRPDRDRFDPWVDRPLLLRTVRCPLPAVPLRPARLMHPLPTTTAAAAAAVTDYYYRYSDSDSGSD